MKLARYLNFEFFINIENFKNRKSNHHSSQMNKNFVKLRICSQFPLTNIQCEQYSAHVETGTASTVIQIPSGETNRGRFGNSAQNLVHFLRKFKILERQTQASYIPGLRTRLESIMFCSCVLGKIETLTGDKYNINFHSI